jgi:GGDEF domain-containing protein
MIQRVFGAIGQCYRIGGDEFCAVIRKGTKLNIGKYLGRLREEQDSYNKQSDSLKIHIAVGYAVHEESDADMEVTRSRADVLMYRNKKQLKENGER